jgi:hypothetical protein
MSDGGKGSAPRPFSVDAQTFANNWDAIFKKSPREIDDAKAEQEEFDKIQQNDPFGPPPAGGMTTQQGESLGSN